MSKYASLGQGIMTAGEAFRQAAQNIAEGRRNQGWLDLQERQLNQSEQDRLYRQQQEALRLEMELAPTLANARSFVEEFGGVPQSLENVQGGEVATGLRELDDMLGIVPKSKQTALNAMPDLATLRATTPEGSAARQRVAELNARAATSRAQQAQRAAQQRDMTNAQATAALFRQLGLGDIASAFESGATLTAPQASIVGKEIEGRSRAAIAAQKGKGGGGGAGASAQEKQWLTEAERSGFFRLAPEQRRQAIASMKDKRRAAYLSSLPEGVGETPRQPPTPQQRALESTYKAEVNAALQNAAPEEHEEIVKKIQARYPALFPENAGPSEAESLVDEVMGETAPTTPASPNALTYDPSSRRVRFPPPPPTVIRDQWTKTRY